MSTDEYRKRHNVEKMVSEYSRKKLAKTQEKLCIEYHEDFTIEDMGEMELDVYDLEVEDNHNFFANDILVHNSNYFCLDPILTKLGLDKTPSKELIDTIDQFCEQKLGKNISTSCEFIANSLNCFENHLAVKREKISQSAIFVAKKRYALLAWDNEGIRYNAPEVSVTGLEVKRSSTPMLCRKALNDALMICLDGGEPALQDFVKTFRETFMKAPLADISVPSGVKGLDRYMDARKIYKQGCPQHVRATLLYNHFLKTHHIGDKYNPILNGGKMRRVPLLMPNPIGEDTIGFIDRLPEEFGLDSYIDYETLFDKTFLKPLERITGAIHWQFEKKVTLDDFFS